MAAVILRCCYNDAMGLSHITVGGFCYGIDLTQPRPMVDLSDVSFISPFAVVYLGMFLRLHNSNGINFDVTPPKERTVRRYLATQNFWERFNFAPEVIEEERLHRFTTSTSLNDIVDIEDKPYIAEDIADSVRELLIRENVGVDVEEIYVLVSELIDNFERHSTHNFGVFVMQYFHNAGRLVIAVGDCGIGMRASLSQNPRHAYFAEMSHVYAIQRSFEPLVSGELEGGTGLTEVKEFIKRHKGTLTLSSGNGYFRLDGDGTERYGTKIHDLQGVQIELSIDTR